ncbi:FHA domain-containing protein [Elongatibacter sediminis]|uniref:FHA domain-containing protein n=1 Tax=Elongatibacter sediminis TaxID=3119006 RepID=A0AAW9RBH0_9GAMM
MNASGMESGHPVAATGEPLGAVEVLSRGGHVVQRIAWHGDRLRIGRAYDNDIVVSDPYVCPHHLELDLGPDGPRARDLDSVNGSYAGRHRQRVGELPVRDGLVVHFGHSQLRFHAAGGTLAPTLRDTARHGLLGRLGSIWALLLGTVLATAVLVLDELLAGVDRPTVLGMARGLLYPVIGVLAWAGFWALLNRILAHRANFPVHLAITLFGVTALFLVTHVVSAACFAMAWNGAVWWASLVADVTIAALVILAHLRFAALGNSARMTAAAGLAAVLLFGAPATGDILERNAFSTLPYLEPLLWPPAFQGRTGASVEGFFERADELRVAVDREAGR